MLKSVRVLIPLIAFSFFSYSAEPTDSTPVVSAALINPTATPVRPSVNPKIDKGELLGHIQYLSSPEFHGRDAGSADQIKAAEYIAAEFTRYGLEAFGDSKDGKRGFFQEFPIIVFKGLGKNSSMKMTVGATDSVLEIKKDFLPLPAGYKTVKADAGVAFAGYGISAPEFNYDDFANLDLAGKWALILRYEPKVFSKGGNHSKFAALNAKVLSCALRRAAGVLIVTGPLGHENEGGADTLGKAVPGIIGDFHIPVVHITRALADRLLAPAEKKIADLQLAIEKDLSNQSIAIPGAKIAVVSDIEVDEKTTENVIARCEGSDPVLKKECVIVGAHCDHVGMGYSGSLLGKDGAGKMHPGADDNASGTSGMLEIAQLIGSLKPEERPKRTILFMAFSGEEKGLLGSAFYTEHPFVPLADTAAMLNLDMIGRSSDGGVQVSGVGSSKMFKDLVTKDTADSKLKVHLGSAGDGPSDHASFFRKNIPVLFFFTGTHADYHRPTDTWEKINAPVAAETAELASKILFDLANRADRPVFSKAGTGCYLGVGVDDGRKNVEGFPVGDVTAGSPAEVAGIRRGDTIAALNDQRLAIAMDLMMSLTEYSPGDEIELKLKRGTETVNVKVKLGARKAGK